MVCRDDDRFACGVGLDSGALGLLDSELEKPFLLLFCEPNYNEASIYQKVGAGNSSIFKRNKLYGFWRRSFP